MAKKATREAPKPSKVVDAREVKGAQRKAVIAQIGDGGNDKNLYKAKED